MPGSEPGTAALARFVAAHPRLLVLTGAGCSTGSGIPDYRDGDGAWKRKAPVTHQAFVASAAVRARYWARSLRGWPGFAAAEPNAAHHALAGLERDGRIEAVVTQNVDRLHQRAGSRRVIDLHGRLDRVRCLGCGARHGRAAMQERLIAANPGFPAGPIERAPDGDAEIPDADLAGFRVPGCPGCGGVLKPDVVLFGANVPRPRVRRALRALERADALLVVGSSLMVYSGFRFCRHAAERGVPVAAVNLGVTRADALLALKLRLDCTDALPALGAALGVGEPPGRPRVDASGSPGIADGPAPVPSRQEERAWRR